MAFSISKQSWDSGGTSHILPMERLKATFSIEIMTNILDGGKEFTTKRRWIQNSHDEVFEEQNNIERIGQVEVHADQSRSAIVAQSMKHFMDIHWEHLQRGYRPKGQDMTFMSGSKFGNTGPLSLHYGVFMSTLRSQTSVEQREWWVDAGMKLQFIGCYAQTELGHGSNVRGLQTTATFHSNGGDGVWIMNTPTLQSTKWWSTGMYSATHAAVYAQMIIKGKCLGVHVFFVQLRGSDLKPLPGIYMGDIGPKLGDNDCPIGYLRMKNVVIPRRHLMEARSHVLSDGTYVSGPPKAPTKSTLPPKITAKRSLSSSSSTTTKTKNVSHYITMLKTRIGLTNTAGSGLAKACVIAARYSALRLQGFAVSAKTSVIGSLNDPETQILNYQNQLFRVLQWISTAYAIKFVARWLLKARKSMEIKIKNGQNVIDDLSEVHSSAAGLKALCCCMAADGIEDLRRACGGHGYLMSSGIAPLEVDFKGPNTTAEGDYVVLALQTARFLIKSVEKAKNNEMLPGTTNILKPIGSISSYNELYQYKPAIPSKLVHLLSNDDNNNSNQTICSEYLKNIFAYRSLIKCAYMYEQYTNSFNDAIKNGHKDPIGYAREENARCMQTAAICHVRYFILEKYFEEVNNVDQKYQSERKILHQLGIIYALSEIVGVQGNGPSWGGLITSKEVDSFEYAVDKLMKILRPNVIPLVESFDISDTILNSSLGNSNGQVYENILKSAKSSSMNVMNNGKMIDTPPFFKSVEKYLSKDFLKFGHQSSNTIINAAKTSMKHTKSML